MITPEWMTIMARYNRWQNEAVFGLCSSLSDEERREDLGAFFKSIQGTLNHILWADQMWLWRFGVCDRPSVKAIADSVRYFEDWGALTEERQRFDQVIFEWSDRLDGAWLDGELTWVSGATGREMKQPRAILVTHLFNHQTHHRGQVNAMLTRLGLKPGITDLPFQPD